jgi:hypothetical protein
LDFVLKYKQMIAQFYLRVVNAHVLAGQVLI